MTNTEHVPVPRRQGPRGPQRRFRLARQVLADPMARLGLAVLVLLVLAAVLAPLLSPMSPLEQRLDKANVAPAWLGGNGGGVFGTDQLGRDLFSRVVHALRTSLLFGLVTATGCAVIGTVLGIVGGYYNRFLGPVLMRLADMQFSVPFFAVGVALVAVMGPGLRNLAIALMLWSWTGFARTIFSTVVQMKGSDHVVAVRTHGATALRIMARHILPNVIGPIIVLWATLAGGFILAESALSLLGLGVQPPDFSLGAMLAGARASIATAWWAVFFPGLAIGLSVMGFQLLGDAVRDAVNPAESSRTDPDLS
ncbi:ABC transporter permease [Streptomyces sp. NPDC052042]|uniref:ABC transporter permease n=1 Tax=Streptomyces sp. NPDC052042 TaxID=3365683 RepID=UPI0037D6969E